MTSRTCSRQPDMILSPPGVRLRPATDKTKHMLTISLSLLLPACTCPEEVRTWTFPSMVECLKGVRHDSGVGIARIRTETSTAIAGELTNGAIFSCTEVLVPGAPPTIPGLLLG